MKNSKVVTVLEAVFLALTVLSLLSFSFFAYRPDFSVSVPSWQISAVCYSAISLIFTLAGFIVTNAINE